MIPTSPSRGRAAANHPAGSRAENSEKIWRTSLDSSRHDDSQRSRRPSGCGGKPSCPGRRRVARSSCLSVPGIGRVMRVGRSCGRSQFHGEEEEEGRQEGRQEEEGPRLSHPPEDLVRGFGHGETTFRQGWLGCRGLRRPRGSFRRSVFSGSASSLATREGAGAPAFRRERPARALGRPGRPNFRAGAAAPASAPASGRRAKPGSQAGGREVWPMPLPPWRHRSPKRELRECGWWL